MLTAGVSWDLALTVALIATLGAGELARAHGGRLALVAARALSLLALPLLAVFLSVIVVKASGMLP